MFFEFPDRVCDDHDVVCVWRRHEPGDAESCAGDFGSEPGGCGEAVWGVDDAELDREYGPFGESACLMRGLGVY